jgi:hypothetical protein
MNEMTFKFKYYAQRMFLISKNFRIKKSFFYQQKILQTNYLNDDKFSKKKYSLISSVKFKSVKTTVLFHF